jgi:hypothetical protein
MQDPKTPDEWQEACNLAGAALALHASRASDPVGGGPEVDLARCQDIVRRARTHGIEPRNDEVEQLVAACGPEGLTAPPDVWVEDRRWQALPRGGPRRCSYKRCQRRAVALLVRQRRGGPVRCYYCPGHLYGRRIEGGKVLIGVPADSNAARRGWTD